MLRRRPFLATMLGFLLMLASGASHADWWGRRLPDPPNVFIFGYGSLIDTASRSTTAGHAIPAIPARVSAAFGYVRAWNDRSSSGFTALGLRKPQPGENASTINGVIYPVAGDEVAKFDGREAGYARVEVGRQDIEPTSWQRLPEQGRIWAYVPATPGGVAGEGLPGATAEFPVLQSYIDLVIAGALEYGPDFARELIETTADWGHFWLNDRELARRPWVHNAHYTAIDRLLATTAPASFAFPDRLFGEPYAARWLTSGVAPSSERNEQKPEITR